MDFLSGALECNSLTHKVRRRRPEAKVFCEAEIDEKHDRINIGLIGRN